MELTNIIILSLSIATASSTPHGYGTKGGSFAKSGAVAGAVAFPEFGVPAGAGGGSYSSSGSFAKSSASSFASASSGSFSFGGSGGYGGYGGGSSGGVGGPEVPGSSNSGANGRGDGGYGGGFSSNSGGAAIAGANANAYASAQSGSNGVHGSPNTPCTGNCPSPGQEKQPQPDCRGPSCEGSIQEPKCTSGACDGSAAHSSVLTGSNGGHGPSSPDVPCTENCHSPDQEKPQQPICQGPTCRPSPAAQKCTSGACDASVDVGSTPADSYGGHGLESSKLPCTGNCPSPNLEKQQQPSCQGPSCEPRCTSGACDTAVDLADSQSFGQSPSEGSIPPKGELPSASVPVDAHDRPGKVSIPGPNDALSPGNNKDHPYSTNSGVPGHQLCSPHGCGNTLPNGGKPCTTIDCSQTALITPGSCTSPGCGKISPDSGAGAYANANAEANAGAVTGSSGNGNSPQVNPAFGRTPILNTKPNFDLPKEKSKDAQYGGGFGGPPGILKPNDYSVAPNPTHSLQPGSHPYDSRPISGHNGLQGALSHQVPQGAPSQPSIYQQPPSLQNPTYPAQGTIPSGTYVHEQKPSGGHYAGPGFTGSGAFAEAAAGASGSAYTGGFGGPPGILKPNDFSFHVVKPGGFARPHGDKIPIIGTGHIGPYPTQSVSHNDETPYQGGFGGAPGVIRPNGPSGTGTFPSRQPQDKYPQQIFPGKPDSGCITGLGPGCSGLPQAQGKPESAGSVHPIKPSCGPGSICGGEETYHGGFGGAPGIIRPTGTAVSKEPNPLIHPIGLAQAQSKPESAGYVHPTKPSTSCGPGSMCGDNESYHGSFGGAPGIIRPTGTAGSTETNSVKHEDTPEGTHTQHGNSDSGNIDGTTYQTQFGGAPGTGSYSSGSSGGSTVAGAFSGATAGATAGAIGGYGGYQGGYGGQQEGYGGHPGGHGDHLGGYPHHLGYGGQGAYGGAGGAFGTKSTGSVKGCSSGCGAGEGVKGGSYGASGGDNAGFHSGLGGALAGAKSAAGSFGLAGNGAGAGAGAGAIAGAAAVAGAGAGAGGAGGHYGHGGSFASAQASASASAKSYGGYH